jgi:transcriptional regulator with XRE-family HTH domain
MSYRLKIDRRSLKAAKLISKLQTEIQKALIESGMTQQEVAERLGVDRSVINRRLKGSANLTARSISDFAYVLDRDVKLELVKNTGRASANYQIVTASSEKPKQSELTRTIQLRPSTESRRIKAFGGFERLEA